jgi:inner membrane transporter RhtA
VSASNPAGALALAVGGVAILTDVRIVGEPLGFVFAAANCLLFAGYVLLAMLAATLFGIHGAAATLRDPLLLLAGLGVEICSSVIPYACNQMAMVRLPRASFPLMLSLLPATATALGLVVLGQHPHPSELVGIGLVIAADALHREAAASAGSASPG